MALIKIFSLTGVEIEYKKDSLTLKKENNSMSSDFKVPHSSFPFLIIENDICKNTLGPSDITSIRKNKIVPVIILENGVRYYGEIQQLSAIKNFRKCNLKYGSDLLKIINKKIADYMPVVSVIPGETTPSPYKTESNTIISGSDNWNNYALDYFGKNFPLVKWQFPVMNFKNKYGSNLETTDTWHAFEDHLNNFIVDDDGDFNYVLNFNEITLTTTTVKNYNVAAPCVFLLSPLFYVLQSLGWKYSGDFTTHDLIKKLLFLSNKDNMTSVIIYALKTDVEFNWSWQDAVISSLYNISKTFDLFTGLSSGNYVLNYSFTIPAQTASFSTFEIVTSFRIKRVSTSFPFFPYADIVVFNRRKNSAEIVVEGTVDFRVDPGVNVSFEFYSSDEQEILDYEVFFRIKDSDKTFQQMHPTIETGRYVPDWTVGNYLSYLKNQFNLDVVIDDFKKEVILNLNENIDSFEQTAIISQSLLMKEYDLAAYSSFVLKYDNDEDLALFITQNDVVNYDGTKDDFTNIISSKFKFVPSNSYTTELSEKLKEKSGVGLMIYEPTNAPFTSIETDTGFNLNIQGVGGIYETFFRRWIKFILNGSNCDVIGYFTETEINKINQTNSVYINNQKFRLISIETSEDSNNFQQVKMNLISVNY